MASRARVGSKAGVVVKRGAGGRIMGSVGHGGKARTYSFGSAGHQQSISVTGRRVNASSYFPGTPGRQAQHLTYQNVDRGMAAKALRAARSTGPVTRRVH